MKTSMRIAMMLRMDSLVRFKKVVAKCSIRVLTDIDSVVKKRGSNGIVYDRAVLNRVSLSNALRDIGGVKYRG
eukprot:scaffold34572_cov54-Attheya_sp.AAC.6